VQRLWEVARLCFGEGSEKAKAWISVQQEPLLDDKVKPVIEDIGLWYPTPVAAEEVHQRELNYLNTHPHRMQYKTFRNGRICAGANGCIIGNHTRLLRGPRSARGLPGSIGRIRLKIAEILLIRFCDGEKQ
jgi:hypothetical protein